MLFQGSTPREALIQVLLLLPIILIALTVHEYSHGYAAYRLGDSTAKSLGRLTLNPIKHIDPFGFLMLMLAGFGWAKPVPVNMRYLKHGRWGVAIVSAAGPLSNLVLAFFGLLLLRISLLFAGALSPNFFYAIYLFFQYFILINAGLAVFNLFPIPPLDGSRILSAILPAKLAYWYLRYEMYIRLALLALLFLGVLSPAVVLMRDLVLRGMEFLLDLIPGL